MPGHVRVAAIPTFIIACSAEDALLKMDVMVAWIIHYFAWPNARERGNFMTSFSEMKTTQNRNITHKDSLKVYL